MLMRRIGGIFGGRQHVFAEDVGHATSPPLDDVPDVRAEIVRVGEAELVAAGGGGNFFRLLAEDDVEVVDAGLDGLVAGERRKLVAAEVGRRRSRVLLLQVDQLDDVRVSLNDVTGTIGPGWLAVDGRREGAGS